MAVTDRLGQIIVGVVMMAVGAVVAVGPFIPDVNVDPTKWTIFLAAGCLLMGGWLLDPKGVGERLNQVRRSVPFLDDPLEDGDSDA